MKTSIGFIPASPKSSKIPKSKDICKKVNKNKKSKKELDTVQELTPANS